MYWQLYFRQLSHTDGGNSCLCAPASSNSVVCHIPSSATTRSTPRSGFSITASRWRRGCTPSRRSGSRFTAARTSGPRRATASTTPSCVPCGETSPVSSQGIVYIGASDGYLYAIDQSTGIIKDKLYFGAPVFSTIAVSGNRMIVCDFAGNVYCFASN